MSPTVFAVSRHTGDVQARVRGAVAAYRRLHGTLPAAIVVNPRELAQIRAALAALQLDLAVRPNAGCLLPELWLQAPEQQGVPRG